MARITITEQTTPDSPSTGNTTLFVDSVDSNLKTIDSTGSVTDITDTTTPTDNCRVGILDYNDATTVGTPLSLTGGGEVALTNDGLGAFTNKTYKPNGVTDVWDSSTGKFDFTDLSLGDMVDIRLDILVTTTAVNQEITVELELGQGGTSYRIPFDIALFKAAGQKQVNRFNGIYMGDTNTLSNGAQFIISSADDATVTVNGWYCKILIRG